MENPINLPFNPKEPTVMHIDMNSCFASIEQQANLFLRNKPIAVAAYVSPNGCIVAPSVEAKKCGVKTGMRVKEGKMLCPKLVVVPPDPNKYRAVHVKFKQLLEEYSNKVVPKSIDEFVIDLEGYPAWARGMRTVGQEIKDRIRSEIGDWLRVSVGIAPNRFLAKVAAGLHKPDGLEEINAGNYEMIFKSLNLTDLCGIKQNSAIRLNNVGIFTVWDFFTAGGGILKSAFASIVGYYWYMRLHGYEVDETEFSRRSYGNSFSLPKPYASPEELAPILQKLVEKMGLRMRRAGYKARGVHVAILYKDWGHWHKGQVQADPVFDCRDIYKSALKILTGCPYRKPVHTLAVSCFDLISTRHLQTTLLDDLERKERLVKALDEINERWGNFVITPAHMLGTRSLVPDRIAFGGVKELEEIVIG